MATSLKVSSSSDGRVVEHPTVAHPIRMLTENDTEWMLSLSKRRYDNRYDFQAGELWYRNLVLKAPMVYWPVRTENAFLIGMCSTVPWRPQEIEANVVMLAAEQGALWEAVTLCRASLAWAKRRKAIIWRITSETSFDLGPIAVKLGAEKEPSRYVVRLECP